jgi:hypothetical protein
MNMFYDVIEKGRKSGETTISHDDALAIVIGGAMRFLREIKKKENIEECERILYCIAKASNAIQIDYRDTVNNLLGLIASMDPNAHSSNAISYLLEKLLDVYSKNLEKVIDNDII